MKSISRSVLESALSLLPVAASIKECRYNIEGVLIISKPDGVTLVATNGIALAEKTLSNVECPRGRYFVRHHDKLFLQALLRSEKYRTDFDAEECPQSLLISGTTTKAEIERDGRSFPDYQSLWPNHREQATICLNAEALLAIAEALKCSSKEKPQVRITFDPTELRAILVEPMSMEDGVSRSAMLMPVRDDKKRYAALEAAQGA